MLCLPASVTQGDEPDAGARQASSRQQQVVNHLDLATGGQQCFRLVSKPDQPDPALATAIRQLREQRGETQEDIAYRTRMTVGSYGRIERGSANPTWTNVRRIAQALEISVTDLAQAVERADSQH